MRLICYHLMRTRRMKARQRPLFDLEGIAEPLRPTSLDASVHEDEYSHLCSTEICAHLRSSCFRRISRDCDIGTEPRYYFHATQRSSFAARSSRGATRKTTIEELTAVLKPPELGEMLKLHPLEHLAFLIATQLLSYVRALRSKSSPRECLRGQCARNPSVVSRMRHRQLREFLPARALLFPPGALGEPVTPF